MIGTGQIDSLLLKDSTNIFKPVTSLSGELNYFEHEGTLSFEDVEGPKFLSFGYTVKNQFISEECGSSFVLSDLRILEHDFDSVRVSNPTPTKTGGPNIEIYRCPETDILTIDFNQLLATTNGITITNPRSSFISHAFEEITNSEDSIFSGQAATVKLPVDLSKNDATFIFKTDISQDTVVLRYNRVTEERYKPCGVQTFVNNLTIGTHTFDSLSYGLDEDFEPVRSLLDPQTANLRVFDCPQTNLLQVRFKTSTNTAQTVTIKSITAGHITGNLPLGPNPTSVVILPVDLESDASTFVIEYDDNSTDTVSVQYTRTALTLFNACPDPVINNLREAVEVPNITVPANGTTLQFPTVPNVEITVE